MTAGEHCSFCGKARSEVATLIRGGGDQPARRLPVIHICDECVGLCAEILKAERGRSTAPQPVDSVLVPWRPVVVDGRTLEWSASLISSDGAPAMLLTVRRPGEPTGPGVIYGADVVPTDDLACDVARRSWTRWNPDPEDERKGGAS